MPTPVIVHPMIMASGAAPVAIFCGRLKTPAPIIEPSTRAMSAPMPSFCDVAAVLGAVVATAVVEDMMSDPSLPTDPRRRSVAGACLPRDAVVALTEAIRIAEKAVRIFHDRRTPW